MRIKEVRDKNSTRKLAYVAIFSLLIAVGAWVSVPLAVPFTLQTFFIFLGSYLLGAKCLLAIAVYILLGIVGVPVFAGMQAGVGVLLSQTGGYMLGWAFIPLTVCVFNRVFGRKTWAYVGAMSLGLLLCYALGTVWFAIVYTRNVGAVGVGAALLWCVVPFLVPDLAKMAAAIFLGRKLEKTAFGRKDG